jgi:hypothetical protein
MIDDPFLNYFALGLLLFIIVMMFYAIIAIHDIPARRENYVFTEEGEGGGGGHGGH